MSVDLYKPFIPPLVTTPLFTTHYEPRSDALAITVGPYTSLYDKLTLQINLFKRAERTRINALFPIRLKAGQSEPPNGGLGMNIIPPPPERIQGAIYSSSI